MEERINVAELLKNCPSGMELDCTMYNQVSLINVDDYKFREHPISVLREDGYSIRLTKYGQYIDEDFAKCVIFPKGKTTWEGFVPPCKFKDGDIITDSLGTCIFKGEGEGIFEGCVKFYCGINNGYFCVNDEKLKPNGHYGYIVNYRLSTEEEKQKLFDAIKANGYRWNEETKTLEKLVESKEDTGDRAVISGICFDRGNYADEVELHLGNYEIEIRDGKTYAVFKSKTKTLEKLITPKFKVGDRVKSVMSSSYYTVVDIKNNNYFIKSDTEKYPYQVSFENEINYKLVPNKFDINTLVPFESRVLVRDLEDSIWRPAIFGCYTSHSDPRPYYVLGGIS